MNSVSNTDYSSKSSSNHTKIKYKDTYESDVDNAFMTFEVSKHVGNIDKTVVIVQSYAEQYCFKYYLVNFTFK